MRDYLRYLGLRFRRTGQEIKNRFRRRREYVKVVIGFVIGTAVGWLWLGREAAIAEVKEMIAWGFVAAAIVWVGEALWDFLRAPSLLYQEAIRMATLSDAQMARDTFQAEFLRLLFIGEGLYVECNEMSSEALPHERVEEWTKEVKAFLLNKFPTSIGQTYVNIFLQDAGMARPVGHWGETPQAILRSTVESRKYRLKQIVSFATLRQLGNPD